MPYSSLFVVTCRTVCCLLPHAVQFAFCCHMLYSLLIVVTCRTVCYLLPHVIQFAISFHMPYSLIFVVACHTICYLLPHAVQFAVCCRMPYSLLFVAACCTVCYLLPHAMQYAVSCCTLYSFLFIAAHRTVFIIATCHTILLFAATCMLYNCYFLPHDVQSAIIAECCIACRTFFCLLPHAIQFCYWLPDSAQLVICCCLPYDFLLTYCSASCSLPPILQFTICCCKLHKFANFTARCAIYYYCCSIPLAICHHAVQLSIFAAKLSITGGNWVQ